MALIFNRHLFEYVTEHTDVHILNFDCFCNNQGFLDESLGRFMNPHDSIHLGKLGYRLLAKLMKDHVMINRVDGRPYANMSALNRDIVNRGSMNHGSVNRGSMNRGSMNHGSMQRGSVNSGTRVNRESMNLMRIQPTTSNTRPGLSQQPPS